MFILPALPVSAENRTPVDDTEKLPVISLYNYYYRFYYQHFITLHDEYTSRHMADHYAQHYADYYTSTHEMAVDTSIMASADKLTISALSARLIQHFEGLRTDRYKDMAGLATIGYGHQVKHGEHLYKIDEEEALQLFIEDIDEAENAVRRLVKVPLTRNQFSALVSLVYNIGEKQFSESTLLVKLNETRYDEAADEFLRWRHVKKRPVRGLEERRQIERDLFLS